MKIKETRFFRYSSYIFGQIFFKIARDDLRTEPHKSYQNRLSGTAN